MLDSVRLRFRRFKSRIGFEPVAFRLRVICKLLWFCAGFYVTSASMWAWCEALAPKRPTKEADIGHLIRRMLCASSRRIRRQANRNSSTTGQRRCVMQLFTLLSWQGKFQALDGRQNKKQEISKNA